MRQDHIDMLLPRQPPQLPQIAQVERTLGGHDERLPTGAAHLLRQPAVAADDRKHQKVAGIQPRAGMQKHGFGAARATGVDEV